MSNKEDKPGLYKLDGASYLRPATNAERYASYQASKQDQGAGAIIVDGIACYVEVWHDDEEFVKKFKYGLLEID